MKKVYLSIVSVLLSLIGFNAYAEKLNDNLNLVDSYSNKEDSNVASTTNGIFNILASEKGTETVQILAVQKDGSIIDITEDLGSKLINNDQNSSK